MDTVSDIGRCGIICVLVAESSGESLMEVSSDVDIDNGHIFIGGRGIDCEALVSNG